MANKELQAKRTECLVYSRVVGWLTPIKNYNPGKTQEYKDRVNYKLTENI